MENTVLQQHDIDAILPFIEDGKEVVYTVKRGLNEKEVCLKINRSGEQIKATGSYFVGVDWLKENELAIGDKVISEKFGKGVIKGVYGKFYDVKFEDGKSQVISKTELSKYDD